MADSSFAIEILAKFEQSQKNLESFSKDIKKATEKISKDFGLIKLSAFATGLNQGIELVKKLGSALSEPIRQAAEFEADVNSLRIALDATGQSTEDVVQSFIAFGSAIQSTTKFSDNAVITTAALIQNIAQLSQEDLKGATKAALDLSVALGIDLSSAASLVAKAANGNVAAFKRYGIEIQKGKNDTETFANALGVLTSRFGGASEKSVGTFAGALAQLRNNFEDSLKTFGAFIIQNENVTKAINALSQGFVGLSDAIKTVGPSVVNGTTKAFSVLSSVFSALIPITIGLTLAQQGYNAALAFGRLQAFIAQVGGLRIVFQVLTTSVLTATKALLLNPIVLGGAAIAAIIAFSVNVYKTADSFNSLKDAILGTIFSITEVTLRFFGASGAADSLNNSIEKLKSKKVEVTVPVNEIQEATDRLNDLKKAAREQIKADQIASGKARAQFEETANANFDKIKEALQKAGKSEYELVVSQREEQFKVLKEYAQLGSDQAREANALRLNVEAEFEKKRGELNQKSNEYWAAEADKTIAEAKAKIDARNKAISGSITTVVSGVQQGASGVVSVASSLLSSLGPYGQAAGAILSFLSQGPEAVRAQLQGFIDGIPTIIDAMAASVPVVFEVLAQNAGKITTALSLQMPIVANTLAIELVRQSPNIALAFINSLIAEAGRLITAIAEGVKQAISQVTNVAQGKGPLGAVLNPVAAIGRKLKFADGGVIPGGFPNDSFPAQLTSGEGVVPVDTMRRLNQYLSKADSGSSSAGGGSTIIKLVVGEQELANVLLNLNRQGFRT